MSCFSLVLAFGRGGDSLVFGLRQAYTVLYIPCVYEAFPDCFFSLACILEVVRLMIIGPQRLYLSCKKPEAVRFGYFFVRIPHNSTVAIEHHENRRSLLFLLCSQMDSDSTGQGGGEQSLMRHHFSI